LLFWTHSLQSLEKKVEECNILDGSCYILWQCFLWISKRMMRERMSSVMQPDKSCCPYLKIFVLVNQCCKSNSFSWDQALHFLHKTRAILRWTFATRQCNYDWWMQTTSFSKIRVYTDVHDSAVVLLSRKTRKH
jgi:hypothetical protein